MPGKRDAAESLGVAEYLIKPISREDLLAVLDRLGMVGKTILVVDDEPDVLRLFRRMLASSRAGLSRAAGEQRDTGAADHAPGDARCRPDRPDHAGDGWLSVDRGDARRIRPCGIFPSWSLSARDPSGQPIVSKSLAVVRAPMGSPCSQLLATIDALVKTLSAQQVGLGIQSGEETAAG